MVFAGVGREGGGGEGLVDEGQGQGGLSQGADFNWRHEDPSSYLNYGVKYLNICASWKMLNGHVDII